MGCFSSSPIMEPNPLCVDLSHFIVGRVLGKGAFGKVNAVQRINNLSISQSIDSLVDESVDEYRSQKSVKQSINQSNDWFALKTIEKSIVLKRDNVLDLIWFERWLMISLNQSNNQSNNQIVNQNNEQSTNQSSDQSTFCLTAYHCFQDEHNLYIVMPLMLGGDFSYFLQKRSMNSSINLSGDQSNSQPNNPSNQSINQANNQINEKCCRFYMAELMIGLENIHSLHCVYRDLKAKNVLIDEAGHVILSDFGLTAKIVDEDGMMEGYCGTDCYMAPEVRAFVRYDWRADFYSLGVLMYEMLHGCVPRKAQQVQEMKNMYNEMNGVKPSKKSIHQGEYQLYFHPWLTSDCRDFIQGLLCIDPNHRLGSINHTINRSNMSLEQYLDQSINQSWNRIHSHPWCKSIDWLSISHKLTRPPFRPDVSIVNCDPLYELEEQILFESNNQTISDEQQNLFDGWEYNTALNQSTQISVDQPTSQSIPQSINPSATRPSSRSIVQSINLSNNQSIQKPHHRSNNPSLDAIDLQVDVELAPHPLSVQ